MSCFAHKLQLSIHDGLRKAKRITKVLNKTQLLSSLRQIFEISRYSQRFGEEHQEIKCDKMEQWISFSQIDFIRQ